MKFEHGMPVEYRGTRGWVDFINHRYITICFIDIPDRNQHNGRYQASLIVYPQYWHEVRCCVDQTEKEQESETAGCFLQTGRCDSVGATH